MVSMIDKFRRMRQLLTWLSRLQQNYDTFDLAIKSDYKHPKVLIGTMLSRLNLHQRPNELCDVEFQVFSQFGDDGIIQYLMHSLPISERRFVEFGVEDYTEANTRFLLVKDKWSGLVLDGNERNIDYIRRDRISALFDLRAQQAFVTAENVDELILNARFSGKIGLLSIDIDGMDYWVWRAITAIDPAVVVIEYNAIFGSDRALAVPYKQDFIRSVAHPSLLYWGASLAALQDLGEAKGYTFLGCNGNGNNAYFLRNELANLPSVSGLERSFRPAAFAEYSVNGRRVRGKEAMEVMRGMPVIDVRTGAAEPL
jgi:hypothetical protein